MQLSTKTLSSLLIATATMVMPNRARLSRPWRRQSRFERLLRHHDHKGELRASLFGTSPQEFKTLQKRLSFDETMRRYGFSNERAFRLALLGKIKSELKNRGWSRKRIDNFVDERGKRVI